MGCMGSADISDTSQATLLQRARTGDPRVLGETHDRDYPALYRYALFRLGDDAAAQDVASEVFLRLLDALRTGRPPQTSLGGWLFGVAAHLVVDHFRRAPRESAPLSETLVWHASPAIEVEKNLQHAQLRAAIRPLTRVQREMLATVVSAENRCHY